ncbi:hypothetical protein [Parasedimentitalea huanghaiensis]|uniref:DNA-binding protein n=1 Tax=Parasedimentitalea huanghaiensis TaxID=2682100 RepID=A0A6L6WGM1_9RHOB|nr:hypothetical protein [Zongyanglinia huanghaiensis]MVO14832.1 hypothetical protein [Zongyanglinia huanghaiensis]
MGKLTPLAVGERNAAKLMDMTLPEFKSLVKCGSLPAPVQIAQGPQRWRVADLDAILNGEAMNSEQITW